MRTIFSIIFLTLLMSGCATQAPYGNYLAKSAKIDQTQLAVEAVNQLVRLYPPAWSRFEMKQPTEDPFGQSLVKGLRESGYAVLELKSIATETDTNEESATPEEPIVKVPSASESYPLSYVLDSYVLGNAGDPDLYRLILMVGTQSIMRPYLYQNGKLIPAGYWVRKE